MRVLGFIKTTPDHKHDFAPGVVRPDTPLPILPQSQVSDACYCLNEYHLQIDFILRESGYLNLQESGLKWRLHYRGQSFPVVLHPYVPFIIGDTEGHDLFVVTPDLALQVLHSSVLHVSVQIQNLVIQKPAVCQSARHVQ